MHYSKILLTTSRIFHKVSKNGSVIFSILVLCHQGIITIVHMSRVVQLKAAMVFSLIDGMYFSADIVRLIQFNPIVQPCQDRLWVPSHAEWYTPVVVRIRIFKVRDIWCNYIKKSKSNISTP